MQSRISISGSVCLSLCRSIRQTRHQAIIPSITGTHRRPYAPNARIFTSQVILVSAQCSKSGIIDPVDFIVSEGEDMGILKYLSRGEVDQAKLGELITQHNKILKHAMQCKIFSRFAWSRWGSNIFGWPCFSCCFYDDALTRGACLHIM